MSGVAPVAGVGQASALANGPAAKTDREKLHEVAQQFEAVFLREMLSAARQTSFAKDLNGEGGAGDISGGQGMDTFRQMQDEHFADTTARTGTLGMAALIEAQMARFVPDVNAGGQAAAAGTSGAAQTSAAPQVKAAKSS